MSSYKADAGTQKKHRKSGITRQAWLSCRIPALYGARAVSILGDRLRIRDQKSLFVIRFFKVIPTVVFSLELPAPFLFSEVGEVHDILRFAFGALGNEVSADIRKHPVNDKLAFGASYFPHRKSSCFSFAQFQLGLYVRRWRRTVISLFSLAVIHFRHHLSSSAESIPAYPFAPEAHIS